MNAAKPSESIQEASPVKAIWRLCVALYLLGLLVFGGMAALQDAPGYMDADYYFAGGLQIAKGEGLREPFLWNYLDDPPGLPHPAFAYWMPLASWVAALGMLLTRSHSFHAAQVVVVLLAAGIPSLTALLAFKLNGQRRDALLAGCLALFAGFYFPYLTTTDTFGLYMLAGAFFLLWLGDDGWRARPGLRELARPAGLGVVSGLMHLARADGLVWLAAGLLSVLLVINRNRSSVRSGLFRSLLFWWSACLAGYLLVMGPWMVRNLSVFGSLLAPGGARALWITHYDELYNFPASGLTFQHWLQSGIRSAIVAAWQAFLQNIQTVLAVQGQIFLVPLIVLGAWKLHRDPRVQTGLLAWLFTLLAMTLVFPYQGSRGGLFHSGAAIQPLFWAVAPAGLGTIVNWCGRVRRWNVPQALAVFQAGIIGLAFFLTALLVAGRVVGDQFQAPVWNLSYTTYQELGATLRTLGAQTDDVVMVNNAPGFYIATGFKAISVPNGPIDATLQAAQRYHACYLLIEPNHPTGADALYSHPENYPGLIFLKTDDQTQIFRLEACARMPQ